MSLGIALRAFFKSLFNAKAAEQIAVTLEDLSKEVPGKELPSPAAEAAPAAPKNAPLPTQDSAITLLAALQRDARLIDLIHEDLQQYQDAQVGAAARPCLKQCRETLQRFFAIEKLANGNEGDTISIENQASSTRYRWVDQSGNSHSQSDASQAKLVHAGWEASKSELPKWTGDSNDAMVIAPAQISGV